MKTVIREVEIGSPLYATVMKKVERNETIKFTNGHNVRDCNVFRIVGAKAGRRGFINVELQSAELEFI